MPPALLLVMLGWVTRSACLVQEPQGLKTWAEGIVVERTLLLLVSLYIHPGQEMAFREFEFAAARIMGRYGGRIERVIRPERVVPEGEVPHEVHLASFPDEAAFVAYRADAELAGLTALRQAAIARTEILFGVEGELY